MVDAAEQRYRLTALYLDGLTDDDGRVRRSAVTGLKRIAYCAAMAGAADELRAMLLEIRELGEERDGEELQQVREAYRGVEHQGNSSKR